MGAPLEEDFFCKLFSSRKRRASILANALCIVPPLLLNRKATIIDAFEYLFAALAVQPCECKFGPSGLRVTEGFLVPRKCLKDEECVYLKQKEFDMTKWQLKDYYRALLVRDFVNICVLQHKRVSHRRQWPLFALMAVQRLIFVQQHYIPLLFDAERSLQGRGELPLRPRYLNGTRPPRGALVP